MKLGFGKYFLKPSSGPIQCFWTIFWQVFLNCSIWYMACFETVSELFANTNTTESCFPFKLEAYSSFQ
jgi:hypothetical protein